MVKEQIFKLDLDKDRPYFAIEEEKEYLLILTLTTNEEEKPKKNKKGQEDKPSFSRFGPIKCPCLSEETYIRLETQIFITREFIEKSKLNLLSINNEIKHQCLSEAQYLELRETLEAYWSAENDQLTTISLGMDSKIKKKRSKVKKKSAPLFY